MYHHSRRHSGFCALLCLLLLCLLMMLSACGTISGNGVSQTPAPTKIVTHVAATPMPTIGQTGAAQTCPPAGNGRAAVMPPMTTGNHANVVFFALQDEQNANTLLQRYDVTTGTTETIFRLQQAGPSPGTTISPDGQWIMFEGLVQGQEAIQLVRMDGQQLQTLYCTPMSVSNMILSPDQHYLVFGQLNADETEGSVYLLDMKTGKLQTEVSSLQPNYPVFGQYAAQASSLSSYSSPFSRHMKASEGLQAQLNPLGSKHYPLFFPMKWATNSSVYLLGGLAASPSPPPQLVLLRDITKDVSQQGNNVQPVLVSPETNNCQDIDVTVDNRHIMCSVYTQFGPVGPSSIMLQPATGGTFHTIYSNPTGGALNARALSNPSTILFTLSRANEPPALFKINSDGSGLSQVMAGSTSQTLLNLAASYLPWSNASRDSTLYALQLYDLTSSKETLVYGHISGGVPVSFASSTVGNGLNIVGWTVL